MRYSVGILIGLITGALPAQESPSWIFFSDKPSGGKVHISQASLQRRLTRGLSSSDSLDWPVSQAYTHILRSLGVRIRHESRWFNAVSIDASTDQLKKIRQLPFVKLIRPVAKGEKSTLHPFSIPDYGASLKQNATLRVPAVHALGLTGNGIRIGVLDTGFNLNHPALQSTDVIADSDFVDHDGQVRECVPSDKNCSSHGTYVLSVIAGFAEGSLIGPAYGAEFLLARTEDDDGTDLKAEEDAWIAALEWMEASGADVVTSSISYFDDFRDPGDDYTLSDLDGKTALTTLATDIAFEKGMLVFNSAGNLGSRGAKFLGTPSDGKNMIAVGAMYGDSTVADFSSRGPTKDGRIKPDVIALGVGVRVAEGESGYTNLSGTSLSTPLVAGIAAQALEANPRWSVSRLRTAILRSGHFSIDPDPVAGWGVPDAMRLIHDDPDLPQRSTFSNLVSYPNPANPSTTISFRAKESGSFRMDIYNTLGARVATLAHASPVQAGEQKTVAWNGRSENGRSVASGMYFCRLTLNGFSAVRKILLVR